jgi:hypothetical protein
MGKQSSIPANIKMPVSDKAFAILMQKREVKREKEYE